MTIGNDILPGIITDIESLPAIDIGGLSTANVLLVGEGDLTNGSAEANQPYTITRGSQVPDHFGEDNPISNNVEHALNENARPVYAVVTDEINQTETVSATEGTLSNVPASENVDNYSTTAGTWEIELVNTAPDATETDELEINPTTGDFSFNSTPSTDIDYVQADYSTALTTVVDEAPDEIDYVYVLSENDTVIQDLNDAVNNLADLKNPVIGGVGFSAFETDLSNISAPVDNSRMQIFYPSRNVDGKNVMGAVGGLKASKGISGSTMSDRISAASRMNDRIDEADQINLVGESIVPIASETRGAKLIDDPTCISDTNSEEENMADGYSRFVIDTVTESVHETQEPYIGKLNKPATRGALQAAINSQIQFLADQDAVVDYSVRVFAIDSMSAQVDLNVKTTKPLRNIYNDIAVGGN